MAGVREISKNEDTVISSRRRAASKRSGLPPRSGLVCRLEAVEAGGMEEGPDGLELELSSISVHGYLGVIKVRNEYHAKVAVDPWPAPQRTLPGKGCASPREAAIRLARYRAAPYPLPPKKERRKRGQGKVRAFDPCVLCLLSHH